MLTPTVPTPAIQDRAPASADRSPQAANNPALTAARRGLAASAMSDAIWVPMVSAILVLALGAMSLATKRPWLFVALGPTAMLLASNPGHATTRFHAIVLGHVTGFVSAWVALLLMGAGDGPTLLAGGISVARVWASALGIAVMAVVQPTLRAYHPPAAATVLLITLGMHKPTMKTSLAMLGGVVVVALLGEWFQRIRMQQQGARP